MKRFRFLPVAAAALLTMAAASLAAPPGGGGPPDKKPDADSEKPDGGKFEPFKPESATSNGTVTIGGQAISYQAVAGTLIVHPKGWDDVPRDPKTDKENAAPGEEGGEGKNPNAEASMFYVAYFKNGGGTRPVTFVYNGGPGSATLWLHMGAFGPRRIVTSTDAHTPAAPYTLVNNVSSLLDATDLVFIDAPGTGFSRIAGKDKEKAFFGVDQDAYAFAEFISQFLSKYGRWNSPKYLFGESYGTPRSAVLINQLEADRSIDFNGVILLSQILNFDLSPDRPARYPVFGHRPRPPGPAGRLRSAIHRAGFGVRFGVQRLCAQGFALWRGQDLQAQHWNLRDLELSAPTAGTTAAGDLAPGIECHAGSGQCDEDQSEPQGAAERGVFRSRDALLSGHI